MTNQIPHDEPVFQISVVARMVGLHQQTIRSYERIGLVQPARSGGNTRLFSFEDVERLRQVVRLVNDLGVNLAGVEVILRLSNRVEGLQRELAQCRAELEQARGARPTQDNNPTPGSRDTEGFRDSMAGGGDDR